MSFKEIVPFNRYDRYELGLLTQRCEVKDVSIGIPVRSKSRIESLTPTRCGLGTFYPGPQGTGARKDINMQATIFCNQVQNYQCMQVVTINP